MQHDKPAVRARPRARQPVTVTSAPVPPVNQSRGDAAMARDHTGAALTTLVAIMTNADAPATARVSAANAVLDRAWGKPRQELDLSTSGDAVAAIQRARLRVHRQRVTPASEDAAGPGDE